MRRRKIEDLAGVPLFNGKRYESAAERQRAVDAWRRRKARLLALVLDERDESEDR